jgi:hypothetical protein
VSVNGGPYLTGAFFCEKILREHDGVLSFIRVVDRWTVTGPAEAMPLTVIQTNLVIQMKSGNHRGVSQITVTPYAPSGAHLPPLRLTAKFEGEEDTGIAVPVPMAFPAKEAGVYWFDVSVDGRSFTKIPLRVDYQQLAAGFHATTPGSPLGPQQP